MTEIMKNEGNNILEKEAEQANGTPEFEQKVQSEILSIQLADDTDHLPDNSAISNSSETKTGVQEEHGKLDPMLLWNRGGDNRVKSEVSKWHYYETAAFQQDYLRRPVFFGTLIAARRIKVGEKSVWTGEVQHINKQSNIRGLISIPYMELLKDADNISNSEAESRINAMIGATVEFIISGVIRETDMIIGSRKKAMEILQRRYYLPSDRDALPQIHNGRLVQARIMAVTPYTLQLDVFGVECKINRQEVKWEWTASLLQDYAVGDVLTVRVENVQHENGEISVVVTGKIGENPDIANLKYTPVNSLQLGEITSFVNGIYFIRLYAGVNAVAHIVLGDKGCGVGDRIKLRVTAFNRELGTVTGKIVAVF